MPLVFMCPGFRLQRIHNYIMGNQNNPEQLPIPADDIMIRDRIDGINDGSLFQDLFSLNQIRFPQLPNQQFFQEPIQEPIPRIRQHIVFDQHQPQVFEIPPPIIQTSVPKKQKKLITKSLQIGTECPICFLDIKKKAKVPDLNCRHIFHKKCLTQWLKKGDNCPMCRQTIYQ